MKATNKLGYILRPAIIGAVLAVAAAGAGAYTAYASGARDDLSGVENYSRRGASNTDSAEGASEAARGFDGSRAGGSKKVQKSHMNPFDGESFDGKLDDIERKINKDFEKIEADQNRAAEIKDKLTTKILTMIAAASMAFFAMTLLWRIAIAYPPSAMAIMGVITAMLIATIAGLSIMMFRGENSVMGLIKELGGLDTGSAGAWKGGAIALYTALIAGLLFLPFKFGGMALFIGLIAGRSALAGRLINGNKAGKALKDGGKKE